MGIYKADDELGNQSPRNGYDTIYDSHTYSDYLFNKRPKSVSAKRFVVFLSIDLMAIFTICGIIDKLTTTKEIIALFVAIAYLVVRLVIIIVKLFSFYGKNHESIKKGWRSIKDLFKE